MKIKLLLKRQQGFTLIESLVALSILLISISGTLGLFTIGFRTLVVPRHVTKATNIARAKMEAIRSILPNDITTNLTFLDEIPLLPPLSDEIQSLLPDGTLSIIYGIEEDEEIVYGVGNDPLAISVVVSWQEDYKPKRDEIRLVTLVTSP